MHEQRYNEIAARGARRRRRDRTLIALRLTAAALALVLVAELAGALWWSPRFRVRQVKLIGVRTVDPALVLARAGVTPGSGLAGLATGRIRRRVEAIPAVESARVARDWPDTLAIVVRERVPAVFIRCGAGIVFLDRRGDAFTAARAHTDGLPELKGLPVELGRLGRARLTAELRSALEALAAAQQAELTVGEVVARSGGELELRLSDGTGLRLGRPEQLRLKVSQAKVALTQLQPLHQVEYVDVSCPDAAVWKPRAEL